MLIHLFLFIYFFTCLFKKELEFKANQIVWNPADNLLYITDDLHHVLIISAFESVCTNTQSTNNVSCPFLLHRFPLSDIYVIIMLILLLLLLSLLLLLLLLLILLLLLLLYCFIWFRSFGG